MHKGLEAAARVSAHRHGDYRVGRAGLRASLLALFEGTLKFQDRMIGSVWAERYGWIPKGTGAEHGKVTLYGYQRGLVDVMCDPNIPLLTVLKAARVGYTRCATLAVGYHLHQDPTLCAIAQPTIPDAEDFGSGEIAPMLRDTPVLAPLLRPARKGEKQDNATYYQLSNGASVRVVGAASDDAFRRYSARFLFGDEIDGEGWTPGAKTQGDKLKLFWTRGETFWNRKQVRGSTPLMMETSRVWKLWLSSDQRRYFVPCPQCSDAAGHLDGWQYLDWGGPDLPHGLKWSTDAEGNLGKVWYVGTCGCVIEERHKAWMDANGEWRPTAKARTPGHVGMHLWTGMSLNPNAAWPVIVQEWLEAQADPATLVQPFVNLRLGRPYKATYGQELKVQAIADRAEPYPAEVPPGVLFLTVGVDVQSGTVNPRLEASVYGWGRGLEGWLIGHFVLPGDPAKPEVWNRLDALLKRPFRKPDGTTLDARAACIDSGGHHTQEVYAFCNRRRTRRVWAIKGRSETNGQRGKVWPRKPSSKLGSVWYMIGGNAARDWAYTSLAVEKPGPRRVHFPMAVPPDARELDEEFFAQLTRERLIVPKGRQHTVWEKPKAPHEAGVCFVYAYAAVCGLQALSGTYVRLGEAEAEEPDAEAAAAAETAAALPAPAPETNAIAAAIARAKRMTQPAAPAQPAAAPTAFDKGELYL
ncbi:phage terminase large subunit family protein [Azospirillum doebereinerae]|uniref:Terminase n=1 Tax=Azospirillum doebereinerae TaxID=92933 RepID=A0A3S0V377_9PROT|nr:terminase gpA endonuclease subunit [Azospirillum doebereinerae]RUQ63994.1 terminase [Azospirillum doebereinerae]